MPVVNDPTCPFCAIVRGDSLAYVVLDEPGAMAFLDTRPLFPGHVLVVPRTHVQTLPEVPPDVLAPVMDATQRLASAMLAGLGAQGSFVAMNNTVSQSVPHLHVHVVPRTKGDGLRGFFWPRTRYADEAAAQAVAERLRDALAAG